MKFFNFWKKLVNNDNFLKILSVLIAVFLWLWIVSTAKPTNKKEFQNIPVQIKYEGSRPDTQGLMMLLSDSNIFVNLVVSGPRSNLFIFSEDDISASLNFSAIAAPGTYQIPVSVTLSDESLSVDSVSPQIMNISFAKKLSRDIPITIQNDNPSENITCVSSTVNVDTVTVTGPEETVNSIEQARVVVECDKTVPQEYSIELLDASGTRVDYTYLTLSTETAIINEAVFSKQITVLPSVNDSTGLPVFAGISVECSPSSVSVLGSYAALSSLNEISLDSITVDISSLTQEETFSVSLPQLSGGLTYAEPATVTVKVSPVAEASSS